MNTQFDYPIWSTDARGETRFVEVFTDKRKAKRRLRECQREAGEGSGVKFWIGGGIPQDFMARRFHAAVFHLFFEGNPPGLRDGDGRKRPAFLRRLLARLFPRSSRRFGVEARYELWVEDTFDYQNHERACYAVYLDEREAAAKLQEARQKAGGPFGIMKHWMREIEVSVPVGGAGGVAGANRRYELWMENDYGLDDTPTCIAVFVEWDEALKKLGELAGRAGVVAGDVGSRYWVRERFVT